MTLGEIRELLKDILLLTTHCIMFETCGRLYEGMTTTWKKISSSLKHLHHEEIDRCIG
jgi:hypothetical protein